jgi:hypothetical protein
MFLKSKSVLLCALFLQIILLVQSRTTDKVITRQPSSTYGFIGTKATFDLQVTSEISHRRLIWYLNDKVLAETTAQRVRIDVKEGMNNSKVHAEVYSGTDLLEVSDPAYLYVVGKPSINVPQYDIHLTPGNSLKVLPEDTSDIALPVFIGQTWAVNLTQYVTGEGLVWLRMQNGRAMTWSEDGLVYMAKGDLQMTVSREDINSIYQLNVTNPAGSVFSNRIKLIKPMTPRFKKNLPKRATVFSGEEVEISVQFEDDGYTRFQWALNGTDLFRETKPAIKLIAHSGLDDLALTVTATNPSGETSQTITLRVLWPKWAIVVIIISIVITLAAALFALVHKGIIRKPACMDSSRVEYSLQTQLDHGDPEDDLELSIDLEDK